VRKSLIYIFLLLSISGKAQDTVLKESSTVTIPIKKMEEVKGPQNNLRKWIIGAGTAAIYGTSFIYLNEAWYKGYPRSSFHAFNDFGEWKQIDKIGHAWSAYNTGRATASLWQWAGVSKRKSLLLGPGTSLLYMLSIEYLDGRSAEWGWSWGDVGADIFGSALFTTQEAIWNKQKIQLKFSSHKKRYDPSLTARANDLFGKSLPERILKDYNAQTYWLSFNINDFLKSKNFPSWFNISVGYGADGMLGGEANVVKDKNGNITFDRRDVKRYRQLYLAPDVDLTKIKTNSKFLRTFLFAANCLKVPSPSLEISQGKLKGHWFQF
jgi:hypothetical protein